MVGSVQRLEYSTFITLFLPCFAAGSTYFTKTPNNKIVKYVGDNVVLNWTYVTPSKDTDFGKFSPIWTYYYPNDTKAQLASENKDNSWKWEISSSCPKRLRSPVQRIFKSKPGEQFSASINIMNLTLADSGKYECRLMMEFASSVLDDMILTVKDIDECASNPCMNGGSCTDLVNGFRCTCVPGWTGARCEIEIDECDSNPCLNGGTCTDLVNGFRCTCVPGWTGARCEIDIDECDSNPCLNGGTCTDLVNRFNCTCVPGWTGARCEIGPPKFVTTPINEVKHVGDEIVIKWTYNDTDLQRTSLIWNYYEANGSSPKLLATESKNNGWKWEIDNSSCPRRLLHPEKRISKYESGEQFSASLKITNLVVADSGIYQCQLKGLNSLDVANMKLTVEGLLYKI